MGNATKNQISEQARRLFGDATCRLQVAALPWRAAAGGLEVMLITSRDTGRWVLPKGWADKSEKLWNAAEREAEEEAGIRGDISRRDAGRYFYAKVQRIGPAVPCEVVVYPLEVSRVAEKWKEKGQRTRQWFVPETAAGLVEEPDLATLIRRFGAGAQDQHANG